MTVVRTSLRNFVAHKGRMILSGLAVLISVAFVCGTLVFTSTMQATFDRLFTESASNVMVGPAQEEGEGGFDDVSLTGRPDTVPASAAEQIRGVEGVAEVTGVVASESIVAVDSDNENIGPTTGAPTVGVGWTELELRTAEVARGTAPAGPGEVMVDSATADNKNLEIGEELRVISVTGDHSLTITGIVDFTITNPGAAILYFEPSAAQQILLGADDAYTELAVDAAPGVGDAELKERVAAALGTEDYQIRTADEYIEDNRSEIAGVFDFLQYVLLGFAGISLLVGIFLIVNTFTMLVAQRTREIGLMRAIGASRKQVYRSVLIEALLLGVVGSVLGFAAGLGIAVGLMALMGALGMNLSTDDLTIGVSVPVIGMVVGVTVTLLAAWLPARRAARVTPMDALREAGNPGDVRAGRLRTIVGLAMLVLGLGALVAAGGASSAGTGGMWLALGVTLTLIGLVLSAPALVGLVLRALSAVLLRGFGSIGRMAERNALRNPRRTGATASALMIGLALVAGLSVVGTSMVASATEEIDESLGADYIIQTANWMPILPEAAEAVRSADHLSSVVAVSEVEATLTTADDASFDQNLGLTTPGYPEMMDTPVVAGDMSEALRAGGIALPADLAEEHGLAVGDQLTLDIEDSSGPVTVTLRAISEAPSFDAPGAFLGEETAASVLEPEQMPLPWGMFALAEPGQADQARASLESALEAHPQMEVRDQADYKELIQQQVGQLLYMVYGLLALAIIVAILGVINTLALAVVERTQEIGLMRAIGLGRSQLRKMVRLESVVIALFGTVLGVALGLAWGGAAQQLLALEGMEVLAIPWVTIIAVFLGAAIVGRLAAVLPARRAARMNILQAIATE
ncbi:ABC transporter permease [Streptomyces aidingensis]|uniref:Putative ABC transport system permease protein n=1 Tax=Streptomyces aidingensis TaxID=910347 RepID=A0A1I1GZE1_9ACTN|nr:FtsX-like permease family protein [Streptomyces aidingensis]SFC14543.1 putative ABC transport system permease protein [Streptomyces aidingensis]